MVLETKESSEAKIDSMDVHPHGEGSKRPSCPVPLVLRNPTSRSQKRCPQDTRRQSEH